MYNSSVVFVLLFSTRGFQRKPHAMAAPAPLHPPSADAAELHLPALEGSELQMGLHSILDDPHSPAKGPTPPTPHIRSAHSDPTSDAASDARGTRRRLRPQLDRSVDARAFLIRTK